MLSSTTKILIAVAVVIVIVIIIVIAYLAYRHSTTPAEIPGFVTEEAAKLQAERDAEDASDAKIAAAPAVSGASAIAGASALSSTAIAETLSDAYEFPLADTIGAQ